MSFLFWLLLIFSITPLGRLMVLRGRRRIQFALYVPLRRKGPRKHSRFGLGPWSIRIEQKRRSPHHSQSPVLKHSKPCLGEVTWGSSAPGLSAQQEQT